MNFFKYELSIQSILFNYIFKMKEINFSKIVNLIIESNQLTCYKDVICSKI